MQTVYERIWSVLEADPGHRGLTRNLPRPDLAELGRSLLKAGEVFILSGFPVQRAGGTGETDGPVGAVNIARGLAAVGKKAAIVTDEASCAAILAACEIAAPDTDVYCVPKRGAAAYC